MKIYIASSWKNKHAVEMLTDLLTRKGHEVLCFTRNNEQPQDCNEGNIEFPFEKWVNTPQADRCFLYDTDGATKSDLVIYIGPSGVDAWAEVGAAFASRVTIYGLSSKGEQVGLMRKMVTHWYTDYRDMLSDIAALQVVKHRLGKLKTV